MAQAKEHVESSGSLLKTQVTKILLSMTLEELFKVDLKEAGLEAFIDLSGFAPKSPEVKV